jgi:hypothetical protein
MQQAIKSVVSRSITGDFPPMAAHALMLPPHLLNTPIHSTIISAVTTTSYPGAGAYGHVMDTHRSSVRAASFCQPNFYQYINGGMSGVWTPYGSGAQCWSTSASPARPRLPLSPHFQVNIAAGEHKPEELIFAFDQLKSVENYYNPNKTPLTMKPRNKKSVGLNERDRVVSVLKDLHESFFQQADEVFSTAVSMFDRFLLMVRTPHLCAKLVLSVCYYLAVERQQTNNNFVTTSSSTSSLTDNDEDDNNNNNNNNNENIKNTFETIDDIIWPTRELILRLMCGGGLACYTMEDFHYWEMCVRKQLGCLDTRIPLAAATPLDYLRLLASGYGLTRQMVLLLNACLAQLQLCRHSPCVLAISVFYACIPKSEWDSWEYPGWFAQRYGIDGEEFVTCINLVMACDRAMKETALSSVLQLLHTWRVRSQIRPDHLRALRVDPQHQLPTLLEEVEEQNILID